MPVREQTHVGRLLSSDPEVPGLELLLDDGALTAWLEDRLPPDVHRGPVRRAYVRLKPGAGGVAKVDRGPGTAPSVLLVAARAGAAKLGKTVEQAPGDVMIHDGDRLAVLAGPGADRDLPGLVRLHRAGPRRTLDALLPADPDAARLLHAVDVPAAPEVLAWKPQRRWVGRLGGPDGEDAVLRACRPSRLPRTVAGWLGVGAVLPSATPRVLGVDLGRGLLAVEHLAGIPLDRLTAGPGEGHGTEEDVLLVAGGLLARLHAARASDGPGPRPRAELPAVRQAAAQLDLLHPSVGASALADRLVAALADLSAEEACPVHGDLSADQLLVRPDGDVALLDLDQAGTGPASLDLASLVAAWWAEDPVRAPGRTAALCEGYGRVRDLPPRRALRVRTASMLLRLAPEPFRRGEPGWPGSLARRTELSRAVLDGRAGW